MVRSILSMGARGSSDSEGAAKKDAKRRLARVFATTAFLATTAALSALSPVAASASAGERPLPERTVCVARDLARPVFFGGPSVIKKVDGRRTEVSGSRIYRDFDYLGGRWQGEYLWDYSHGFLHDNACARAYWRIGWARVIVRSKPGKGHAKRRTVSPWTRIDSELYWNPNSWGYKVEYGIWTEGWTRLFAAGKLGEIKRADVVVKLKLIRKSDRKPVATRYHHARMNIFRDACHGPNGPVGGPWYRSSCAKRYPGYDQSGKITYD